jgi:hypothetical protein
MRQIGKTRKLQSSFEQDNELELLDQLVRTQLQTSTSGAHMNHLVQTGLQTRQCTNASRNPLDYLIQTRHRQDCRRMLLEPSCNLLHELFCKSHRPRMNFSVWNHFLGNRVCSYLSHKLPCSSINIIIPSLERIHPQIHILIRRISSE